MTDVMDKPTTSPISTRKHGDVLIVLSNNPPVNALGAAVRQGLVAAIEEAEADDSVKAVVIACEGQTFFAGADITEFGKPPQHAVAAEGGRHDRELLQAGGRGDPRHRARRRARGRARLPLPRRGAVGEARHARSEARPAAGRGRDAAAAARRRGRARRWRCARPAIRSAPRTAFDCGLVDRLIEGELIPHAVGLCRGSARRPAAAEELASGRTSSTSATRRCSTSSARTMRASSAASTRR